MAWLQKERSMAIAVVKWAVWFRACSAFVLSRSYLEEMCYAEGEAIILPRDVKNVTAGPCSRWEATCCSGQDEEEIIQGKRVNFDPCPSHKMSQKCKNHFQRKLCFQNCSPYIGPWSLNVSVPRNSTRFQYVPLCRSQCELWWENCKHDWVDKENWYPGEKEEYEETKCETVAKKYKDSTYFCEHAFDPFEFVVVPDYTKCISLFGDIHDNRFVAMAYAKDTALEKLLKSRNTPQSNLPPTTFLVLCFFLGGMIAAIGFVLSCVFLAKCRNRARRNNSQQLLFQNRDDLELQESELSSIS